MVRHSATTASNMKDSWTLLWKQPVLFLPQILSYFTIVIVAMLFYATALLIFGDLKEATPASITFFIVILIIFIAISVYFSSFQMSIFSTVIGKKKLNIGLAFKEAALNYWRVLALLALKIIIMLPFLLTFALLLNASKTTLNTQMLLLLGASLLIFWVFLGPLMLYLEPLLVAGKESAWNVLKKSWKLFVHHPALLYKNISIIMGILIIVVVISVVLAGMLILSTTLVDAIVFIINIITSVYLTTFIYSTCESQILRK